VGLAGQGHNLFVIPREMNICTHCRGSRVSPKARIERFEEEKNFLSISVFITQTVPLEESNGRIKQQFGICGWKKRPALWHYTNISVQRMHEQRNILSGHVRNYESVSGIPTL
jgi:hypothetical protein